ncbi:hypothetical protein JD844_015083 [Phrynosoma platyrhinos]|uniref:C3H1-type domain-containing protein n=1 Tax=Phrynosoma platyrhinos TaxID=52577 RepID=A0ABQ7T7L6_PHRPL|nr:hypothetical protein JD844_015083 [Phrynosoma platyrhinos]
MGKRYFCDYCDRSFQDNLHNRKKHLNGVQHLRAKKVWYDLFRGQCDFGSNCRFSHMTEADLEKLSAQVQDPTPLLSSRYNVFQDDEFDVFSKDSVDLSRVQKGKSVAILSRRRNDRITTQSLLNDKRLVTEQRERYNQYSVIVEDVPESSGTGSVYQEEYEDEYDDTYDGNQVGANDADSDDELISRR